MSSRGSIYWYPKPPTRSQQSLLQKKKSYQELNTSYYDPERAPDRFHVLTTGQAQSLFNMQAQSKEWHDPAFQVDEATSANLMDRLGESINRFLQKAIPGPGSK